jgi:hypothetical protein
MNVAIFLAASLACGGTPHPWRFVDDAQFGDRSVLTFRSVELGSAPGNALDPCDQPPTGSLFGVLPLGPGGRHRAAIVWHPASGALWIDANGDGRFPNDERHAFTENSFETRIVVPFGDAEKHERTFVFRKRGDGLAYALRGYLSGSLVIGKTSYRALLFDGDADGCFDNAAADRIWIDKNRDGQFDPLTEQFALGRPVTIGAATYLIRPAPLADMVAVTERSSDTGRLTLNATRLPTTRVVHAAAQLISEWGEWVVINDVDKAIDVPVGRYRMSALTLRVVDADGRTWAYTFYGSDQFALTVAKDAAAQFDMTAGLKMNVALKAAPAPHQGSVDVAPIVVTACGLTLCGCERIEKFTEARTMVEAAVTLEAAGSEKLREVRSGFMCGHFCSQLLPRPVTQVDDSLEVVVRFPSGPLAGDLRCGQLLPMGRKN